MRKYSLPQQANTPLVKNIKCPLWMIVCNIDKITVYLFDFYLHYCLLSVLDSHRQVSRHFFITIFAVEYSTNSRMEVCNFCYIHAGRLPCVLSAMNKMHLLSSSRAGTE